MSEEDRAQRGRALDAQEIERRAAAQIASANREVRAKTDQMLSLPIVMLTEQRDQALRALEAARAEGERQRAALTEEQDNFIAYLMEEQEAKVLELERELSVANERLTRQEALLPGGPPPSANMRPTPTEPIPAFSGDVKQRLDDAETRVLMLQEQLQEAYRDVDEARGETVRMQEERDEAIRGTDEVRADIADQIQAVRDEAFGLQRQLDEANRRVEDARDEVRDEMYRLNEQLDTARRELDERREEVRRLRDRIAEEQSEAPRFSQPPPAPGRYDLEVARAEAKNLRKQLIDSKRDLVRITRELEMQRANQGRGRPSSPEALRASGPPSNTAGAVAPARGVFSAAAGKPTPPGGVGRVVVPRPASQPPTKAKG